jgi:hypothetical protein
MLEKLLEEIRNRGMTQEALTELTRINATLHKSLKASFTGILKIDFEKDQAEILISEGKGDSKETPFRLRNENNIAAMGVGDIDALIIPDTKNPQTDMSGDFLKEAKSIMLVPIANIHTGERIGIINVQSTKKDAFPPEELFLTQEIAFHIAPLVQQVVQ